MEFRNDAFEQLEKRGFIFQGTHLEETRKLLQSGSITFYIGIDPTANDLHIGHFFGLQMARILQDCGHKAIILIGGATAMIGDPTGKKDMRKMLSQEQVNQNAIEIKGLLKRFVRFDGDNPAMIVDNDTWFRNKSYVQFMREVGIHFNVNQMLSAEAYKLRLQQGGLTFLEMGYMLMQAYDFLYLNDNHNCLLQIGGSDQWGNIVAGVELSRKMNFADGTPRPLMMGLTCPLLTNAEGVKMGKTEKGTLWVSRDKTSSYEFYQHFVNCLDADVERLLRFFTKMNITEIKQICNDNIVDAKKRMAYEVTKLVHGEEEARKAEETARHVFGGNAENAENMPTQEIEFKGSEIAVIDMLGQLDIIKSKSQARRLIESGAITIDNEKVESVDLIIDVKSKKEFIVKKGKKTFVKVIIR